MFSQCKMCGRWEKVMFEEGCGPICSMVCKERHDANPNDPCSMTTEQAIAQAPTPEAKLITAIFGRV